MTNPRLSVSGRRYFKDIIYLAILTVVIPLLVSSYLYAMKKPDKSFYDLAAWTLLWGSCSFISSVFSEKTTLHRSYRGLSTIYTSARL
jgi:hypothetical protein